MHLINMNINITKFGVNELLIKMRLVLLLINIIEIIQLHLKIQ
jgi:hypothetical protein